MDGVSIDRLLAQAAQGDRKALGALYDRTAARLYAVALGILDDQGEAENAVEDVFVAIWRNADPNVQNDMSAFPRLIALVRNAAIDRARARSGGETKNTDTPLLDAGRQGETSALNGGDERLKESLARIDEPRRAALRAAFFEGRTYAELAGKTGMGLGEIKSAIRRSLLMLRDDLTSDRSDLTAVDPENE